MKTNLDRNPYTPRYIKVFQNLRDAIDSGEYKPGDRLPSENELIEQYSISRITAISAIEELVKFRLAFREQGRGTFVAQPVVSDFPFHKSFTEVMTERGLRPSSKLIILDICQPELVIKQKLKMPDDAYYRLVRLRLADEEPVAYQTAYLPVSRFPDFLKHDLKNRNLFRIIRSEYQIKPSWSEAIVEAAAADEQEAEKLDIPQASPVLIVWHLTRDDKYQAIEYVRSVYRSDRFSFATGRSPID